MNVKEYEVSEWEEEGKILDLYVCSNCGYKRLRKKHKQVQIMQYRTMERQQAMVKCL